MMVLLSAVLVDEPSKDLDRTIEEQRDESEALNFTQLVLGAKGLSDMP